MSNYLVSRFSDAPVMVSPDRAQWLGDSLTEASALHASVDARMHSEPAVMMDSFWPEQSSWLSVYRPYNVNNGLLTIPVKGLLLHDFSFALGGIATGYTYITRALERGLEDPKVTSIAFVINSGGGEVAGNFDMVDKIYNARGTKPIAAFVSEHAYSAAYSIASAADKVYVARTGGVGSVGVVTSHMDASVAMERMGYRVTFIHAGKHKVEGNPYEPLPDDVKERMQARIDGLYDIFVSTVARNLGLGEDVVRNTEALTYNASEAVEIGLAHAIMSHDEAVNDFLALNTIHGDVNMSETITPEIAQADLDNARAEGASAERERIKGIMGCEEAEGRAELAFHLAMNTDQTVDAAKGILAVSPAKVEQPAETGAAGADFSAAMASGNPDLTPEVAQEQEVTTAEQLIRDYKAATGYGSAK